MGYSILTRKQWKSDVEDSHVRTRPRKRQIRHKYLHFFSNSLDLREDVRFVNARNNWYDITIMLIRWNHPKQNSQIRPSQQRDVLCSPRCFASSAGPMTRLIKRVIADIQVDTGSCTRFRTRGIYGRMLGSSTLGTITHTSTPIKYQRTRETPNRTAHWTAPLTWG